MATNEALSNLVRVGKVCAIDEKKLRVRVQFNDKGKMVSYWLSCLVSSSLKNKEYDLYDIDEDVVCLFLPNGVQRGFVLRSYYPDNVAKPKGNVDKWLKVFEDGTEIEVDRKEHILKIKDHYGSFIEFKDGDIIIKAAGKVYLNP